MAVTPQSNTTFDEIASLLLAYDEFVICGHVSPDGDCIGSQLALASALAGIGKSATCILVKDEPIPVEFTFLPGASDMVPAERFEGNPRVFVGVDVPSRERIGEAACAILDRCDFSITIDHHAADIAMCDYVYVDADAASASTLVWQVVKRLRAPLSVESAMCAYTGLFTDTGGFRFQNSGSEAFACASELVELGVDPAKVATAVYQNRSLASVMLEGRAIEHLEILAGGKAALSYVSMADMESVGAVKADCDPLVEILRSIRGVTVACMLREHEDCVRGSLRAKDDTDVSALARRHDGGGHKAAAGMTLHEPLADAVARMRDELRQLLGSD